MIQNFLTIAWRSLMRNKVYSFINMAGLSMGLACAMLIILYTKDEISYDKFHTNAQQIYRIVNIETSTDGSPDRYNSNTGHFHGPAFAASIPEITKVIRFQGDQRDVQKGNEVIREEAHKADPNFLTTFSFPLLYGDAKTALNHPRSLVMSEDLANRYFGTTNAVGKTLVMKDGDAFVPFEVTAIAKRCPQNSTIKFNMLTPVLPTADEIQNKDNWFNFYLNTFIVMPSGADASIVEKKMKQFYESDAREVIEKNKVDYGINSKTQYLLQPLLDIHLNNEFGANNGLSDGSNPMYSYILSGIALFILLIACINFINLTVARSLRRAKEIGIRKVIGSNRKQLIVQFLGESFLLCLVAFLFAIIMVQGALPTFNRLANKALSLSYLFDYKLIVGYLALLMATGLLAGFYPAMVLSSFDPVKTLYSRFALAGKNYLQRSLVVLQFTLATILIIATITIYKQFNYLTSKPLGYDDSQLLTVEKWNLNRDEYQRLDLALKSNPAILGTAPKNSGYWGTIAKVNGEKQISFALETIDDAYLNLLKIPITSGRNFSKSFITDSGQSVIVNEYFVKEAGWKDPIGQTVNFWYNNQKFNVVGVVKDHHFSAVNHPIGPQLFTTNTGNSFGMVYIKIKPGTEQSVLPFIQSTFKKLFPSYPYSYRFKADENLAQYEAEAKWRQMMLFGAILTIFISCIGLFGLSVLNAQKRVKEIGIRKVLGASIFSITAMLSRDFLKLVILSLSLAMPTAWLATNQWLQNYPYRIDMGWQLFTMAGVAVVLVALFTVSFQALKAAMTNPTQSLRSE